MSPKRGDRAAPPPADGEWDVRFASSEAANGWDELGRKAPGNTCAAWRDMRTKPAPRPATPRHHPLHDKLATGTMRGEALPQWQIEVTGGGRIWYLLDEDRHTVWITYASLRHPKQTDS